MAISKKKLILFPLAGVFFAIACFVAGFFTVHLELRPYKLFRAGEKMMTERHTSGDSVLPSVFINLELSKKSTHSVPTTRQGSGGGVTSAGDELIVMNHEGSLFNVFENSIEPLKITASDNNFKGYQAAAESDQYKDLYHRFNYFRYNDVLGFRSEDSNHIAISYTEWLTDQECYGTTIAVLDYPLSTGSISDISADSDDWRVVFRSKPCLPLKKESAAIEGHMAGGRIDHLDGSKIVLGSGDYAWDGLFAPEILAQSLDNDYGKVIEIDTATGESRIISYGHRNMQGIAVVEDNQIWVVEHGPRGGDELNRVQQDGNFGWPEETLGTRYNKLPWPDIENYGRHDIHIPPTYAWVPSVATSSLTQIQNFHPSWDNDLLVGSFKAGNAYRLRIQNDQIVFAEPLRLINGRIRDIHQHTDGRIVVWSDNETLTFVSVGGTLISETFIEDYLEVANYDEQTSVAIQKTMEACLECHALDPFDHTSAPGLGSVYNGEIASTSYSNYSSALKGKGGNWTESALTEYLSAPEAFAPGTIMPNPQISDPKIIEGIIGLLRQSNTSY